MTVWHLSVSCKLHLAHLASPWIVTSLPFPLSPSARATVEGLSESRSAPATPARTVFSFIVIVLDFDTTSIRQQWVALRSNGVRRRGRLFRGTKTQVRSASAWK